MWQAIIEIVGLEDRHNWKKFCDTEKEADDFIEFHLSHPSVIRWGEPKSIKKNLLIDPAWIEQKAIEKRLVEYSKIQNQVLEALLEERQGRPEKMQEILVQYQKIKDENPKKK